MSLIKRIGFQKPLLLILTASTAACVITAAFPSCEAQTNGSRRSANDSRRQLQFEVVSIHPSKQEGSSWGCLPGGKVSGVQTLVGLIKLAYDVQADQIEGVPTWGASERFAISAIPPESSASAKIQSRSVYLSKEQQQMLRTVLEERFKLTFHRQSRKETAYLLSLRKPVYKLALSTPKDAHSPSYVSVRVVDASAGSASLVATNATISRFAHELGTYGKLTVVDQTGLTGSYDFSVPFTYAPGESFDLGAAMLSGVQEYGFKVQSSKVPIDHIVVDHVQRPAEN